MIEQEYSEEIVFYFSDECDFPDVLEVLKGFEEHLHALIEKINENPQPLEPIRIPGFVTQLLIDEGYLEYDSNNRWLLWRDPEKKENVND